MIPGLHPWNAAIWSSVTRASGRQAHAWLYYGPAGVGKNTTALRFAAHTLDEGFPGDSLRPRELLVAGTHPDLHVLMPEALCVQADTLLARYAARYYETVSGKPKSVISVDQIRRLIERVSTRAHTGTHKCVLIATAERLNPNAANALLKLLEEPPTATLFVLITASPHLLPATVRSRCAPVSFGVPDRASALCWLEEQSVPSGEAEVLLSVAGGAPLRARQLHVSSYLTRHRDRVADLNSLIAGDGYPLEIAARWRKPSVAAALDWLQRVAVDLVRVMFAGHPPTLFHPDTTKCLQEMKKRINVTTAYALLDSLARARQLLDSNVDPNLLLEEVLIDWYDAVARRA